MKSSEELLTLYTQAHEKGVAAIKQGDVPLFVDFPDVCRDRLHVSLRFSNNAVASFREDFRAELEEVEELLGIRFSIATRDFPLHGTLLQGEYATKDPSERERIFSLVEEGVRKTDFCRELLPFEMTYREVLLLKGDVLIASTGDMPHVSLARKGLENVFRSAGIQPVPISFIHCTVARIVALPNKANVLGRYLNIMEVIRKRVHDILNVCLYANDLNIIPNEYDFLTGASVPIY